MYIKATYEKKNVRIEQVSKTLQSLNQLSNITSIDKLLVIVHFEKFITNELST